ncbi:MAG TPA: ATPase domain-containing protein [Methanomassiliicoccales archaeon]|jgi:KaiC/GvpD/RAD55 family RecA-like ATPase|nr:AAA family ATPase [Euryarchaeota archaeon]HOO03417.1 ATPase domain-containing protein [Methanomassiliicoccales archaeon]HRU11125.1 ATPase domain-containing protein [Methanomassiliicoccales archaeon]
MEAGDGRLKTYIDGFDRILEGGIPKGHIVLVAGTPGTMKSSVSYYMLYNHAVESGITSVYVTLEQGRESLLRQMEKMGMDVERVKDNLHVLDLAIIRKRLKEVAGGTSWLHVFKTYIANLKQNLDFSLLVIDSMEVLETMAEIRNRRTDLFYLFEWLRDLGVTVLLISESSSERLIEGKFDEGYLSDGIITLKMQLIRDVEMQRRIRCVKMRETNHDPSYYSLLYNNGRFQVTRVISE